MAMRNLLACLALPLIAAAPQTPSRTPVDMEPSAPREECRPVEAKAKTITRTRKLPDGRVLTSTAAQVRMPAPPEALNPDCPPDPR